MVIKQYLKELKPLHCIKDFLNYCFANLSGNGLNHGLKIINFFTYCSFNLYFQ